MSSILNALKKIAAASDETAESAQADPSEPLRPDHPQQPPAKAKSEDPAIGTQGPNDHRDQLPLDHLSALIDEHNAAHPDRQASEQELLSALRPQNAGAAQNEEHSSSFDAVIDRAGREESADAFDSVEEVPTEEATDIGDLPRLFLNSPMNNLELSGPKGNSPDVSAAPGSEVSRPGYADQLTAIDSDGMIENPRPQPARNNPVSQPIQKGQVQETPDRTSQSTLQPEEIQVAIAEARQDAINDELALVEEMKRKLASDPQSNEVDASVEESAASVGQQDSPTTSTPSASVTAGPAKLQKLNAKLASGAAAVAGAAVVSGAATAQAKLSNDQSDSRNKAVVEPPNAPRKSRRVRKPTQFEEQIRKLIFDSVMGSQLADLFERISDECPSRGSFALVSTQVEAHVPELLGSLALIHALGNKKNVLLVDANPASDNHSLSNGFRQPGKPGFIDACAENLHWKSVVCPTATARLSVVPLGSRNQEVENRSAAISIITEMAQDYDMVMIDAGTFDADFAVPVCHSADRSYLLVRLGKTPRDLAQRAVAEMREHGVELHGTIVTNVPVNEAA